jgi:hypothetical protein
MASVITAITAAAAVVAAKLVEIEQLKHRGGRITAAPEKENDS